MKKTVIKLESIFSSICDKSYLHEWDENFISFSLMQELRNLFSNRVIHFNKWSKIVDWKSFKNKGKTESNFGDISLIVNIQFTSGETLKGIVNIEAKRDFESNNFDMLELDQLQRIYSNSTHSHLLLYNHNSEELPLKFPDESTWKSHLWISPINTAIQMVGQTTKKDNWKILRTSFPFSMFLTSRIFWGFDLDFREEIYEDIVKENNKIIDPSFLGIVNVYYDHQSPIKTGLSDKWEEIL